MNKLVVFLCVCGLSASAMAQTNKTDPNPEKVLNHFVSFTDSVERVVDNNHVKYDTVYLLNPLTGHPERVVSEYLPGQKFFTPISDGGHVYGEQIQSQYYFQELPAVAGIVNKMTPNQQMVYRQTIERMERLLKQ